MLSVLQAPQMPFMPDETEPELPVFLPPPPLDSPKEPPKLGRDEYVTLINTLWQEAKDVRRKEERQWDVNWALYCNQISYPNKLSWQSKGYVPKTAEMVDAKRSQLQQALIRSGGRYFSATPWGEINAEGDFASTVNRLLRFLLNEMDFEDQILPPQLTMAQLANCAMKVYVTRDDYGRLRHQVDPIPPWNYYLDPMGRNQYCVHVTWMDLSVFQEMTLYPGSPFDQEECRKVTGDYRDSRALDEQARREGLTPENRNRKMVQVAEFWGNMDDPGSGKRLHTNIVCSVANEKHLIRWPEKNRFPGGKWPFVSGSVRRIPFRTYPKPPLSDVTPLAMMLNDFYNLTVDSAALRSVPSFEILHGSAVYPEQIQAGYGPGQLYWRHGGPGANIPMIRPIDLGASRGETLQIYNLLQQELGNRVMSQAELGTPGGGKPTATEYSGKAQLTQGFTLMEAQELEAQILEPLFERMVANEIWFRRNYRDDRQLMSVLTQEDAWRLESLSESDRKELTERMRIKVSGISEMLAGEEMTAAIDNLLNRLGRAAKGDVTGQVAQRINWKGMAEYYAEKSGIPRHVVWMSVEEAQQVQQEQMALQQQQMAMQQPPPQPQLPEGEAPPQMQMLQGGMG